MLHKGKHNIHIIHYHPYMYLLYKLDILLLYQHINYKAVNILNKRHHIQKIQGDINK